MLSWAKTGESCRLRHSERLDTSASATPGGGVPQNEFSLGTGVDGRKQACRKRPFWDQCWLGSDDDGLRHYRHHRRNFQPRTPTFLSALAGASTTRLFGNSAASADPLSCSS